MARPVKYKDPSKKPTPESVRLTPAQKAYLVKKYGSLTEAVRTLLPKYLK